MASSHELRRMCGNKKQHATEAAARTHLEALVTSLGVDDDTERLAVYQCDYCGNFHVGRRKVRSA